MSRVLTLTFLALNSIVISAIPAERDTPNVQIVRGGNSTHIVRITDDTLTAAGGRTYSFTVDTPEDQGLVSTTLRAEQLPLQIASRDGSAQRYRVLDSSGRAKADGELATGDSLVVVSEDGSARKTYRIEVLPTALSGQLRLEQEAVTVNTDRDLCLYFTAGQRSPDATVRIFLPPGVNATMETATVNVIGRGDVLLKDLEAQSIGRTGTNYRYSRVGQAAITKSPDGGSILTLSNLDLRPVNGPDLKIVIKNVRLTKVGTYVFKAIYTTSEPDVLTSAGTGSEIATLTAVKTISDFARVLDKGLHYKDTPDTYTRLTFKWTRSDSKAGVQLMQSPDKGKSWSVSSGTVDLENAAAAVSGLTPDTLYTFRLNVTEGECKGFSNPVYFYSGKRDIKSFGVSGDGKGEDTDAINAAIEAINQWGGGTLLFSDGIYNVRTVRLQSNVYLYLESGAVIKALKNGDAPEPTWFSDRQYRSGTSPTAMGPYRNPENWLTKQDVGHTYFRNSMFFAERQDNIKIIGSGRITGDGNLVTGDGVMNNAPDNRSDKMFTFKLCTNIEIGGLCRDEDLWYDPDKDEPYYRMKDGSKDFACSTMLQIDRGGHFVLLATGTDNVHVHNTCFAKHNGSNARDIYDFMACSNVTVTNIYSKVSSDDIVKLGSDCSLGFTRPASNYRVRNIIGDTNCNLFQIGSETADDIVNVCVDNIYVLGANKAGFSISTNDGGHVKDIHLNCGHTGPLHSRSKMMRTRTPFFISISNRGRVLGSDAARYVFTDNGSERNELLCKNVNIGRVENILLNSVDIAEVYGGSSYSNRSNRWKAYDGSQNRATPIIAGYALPSSDSVKGGLDFTLPNGKHAGYIETIQLNDVHVLVKGGNPPSDRDQSPPELGVGQYNVSNLGVQPSYGLWARHAKGLTVENCTFNYETRDSRYAIVLDDVIGVRIRLVKMVLAQDNNEAIKVLNSRDVTIENVVYYNDVWGNSCCPPQNPI